MRQHVALSVMLALALSACGGGGGGGGDPTPDPNPDPGPGQQSRSPTINGTPPTSVVVGSAYGFVPQADDPDGDTLTFSIQNKPDWATFDGATGSLTGTPGAGDIGMSPGIAIAVDDGTSTIRMTPFDIEVTNALPVIAGTPDATVLAGSSYLFEPAASDADGHTLSFTIENRPDWASFDAATGQLSGTPGPADAGNSQPITISVSDGFQSQSMAPFTINVLQVGAWSATLSWTPPTLNEDGSTIDDLAGYKVYYGTLPSNFEATVDVPNPGISSYVVEGLTSSTYYFAVTAYDGSGNESLFSNVVSRTLD